MTTPVTLGAGRILYFFSMTRTLFIFMSLWLVSGCGRGPSDVSSGASDPDTNSALQQMESARIECDDLDHCPESVGWLLTSTPSGQVDSCVATLVSPTRALTAANCLPTDLRFKNAKLADRVRMRFPKTLSQTAETLIPDQVIRISTLKESELGPNYALLSLKHRAERAPAPTANGGLYHRRHLQKFVIEHAVFFAAGEVENSAKLIHDDCTIQQRSYALPQFDHPANRVGVASGCREYPGERGSPLFDDDGLLQAMTIERLYLDEPLQKSLRTKVFGGTLSPIEYILNIGCVPLNDRGNPAFRPECRPDLSRGKILENQKSFAVSEVTRNEALDAINLARTSDLTVRDVLTARLGLQPRTLSIPGGMEQTMIPVCFENPGAWIKAYQKKDGGRYPKSASFEAILPRWGARYLLLPELIYRAQIEPPLFDRVQVEFSPDSLEQTGSSRVRLSKLDLISGKPVILSESQLERCTGE